MHVATIDEQVFFTAGAGATRLAASFPVHDRASGALPVTAVVRKYYPGGGMQEQSLATRAIIVNERYSQIGSGFVVAGVQKLTDQTDGVFISENGVGAWFPKLEVDASGNQRYASPAGDFTRVWKAPGGQVYGRDYPDGTRVRFDGSGQMTDVTDRFDNSTTYVHGSDGRLYNIVDPLGKVTTFYYGCCIVTAIQDPSGRRVYADAAGSYQLGFRNPQDNTLDLSFQYAYDATGWKVLDTYWTAGGDPAAGAHTGWTVAYDAHGKLASTTAPLVATTDAGTTRPVVQARSLEMAVLAPGGTGTSTNPAPRVQPHHVRVEATDPRGNTARVAVDPLGAPTRVEEPLGRVTNIFRDRHGRIVHTEAPSGYWVTYTYVGVELRKILDMNGMGMDAEYEPVFHQPTHIWGKGTTEVWNTYDTADPQRKLLTTRSGTSTSPATSYTYTTRGRVSSVTDAEGHGTFYEYGDAMYGGNPWGNTQHVSTGTASGTYRRTTMLRFDGYGRTITSISPGSDTTHTVYDLNNRVTRSIGAARDTTWYEHRPTGLYRVTDPKAQSYVFNRNVLGWVESEVDPRGQYTYYGYNRAGAPTSMTNRRGQTITSGYDALGRMVSRSADGQQTTWSYDSADRWMQVANSESTNRTEYDVAGRATRIITTLGGVAYTQNVAYDTLGRPAEMAVSGPWSGAKTIGYTYNARGQLETLRDIGGFTSMLGYNDDGMPAGRSLPGGNGTSNSYVSTHAPSQLWFSSIQTTIALGTQYSYNANGLVQARQWYQQDESGTAQVFRHYAYDRQGQLLGYDDEKIPEGSNACSGTTVMDPDGGVCLPGGQGQFVGGEGYTYDKVGNRTDRGGTTETGNRQMTFDGYQFTYDADGNFLGKLKPNVDQLGLGWNSLGQATGAWRAGYGSITYGYDAFGRRVRRTAPDGSVTRFLYAGDDLLMELDGAGNPIREYTYLPGVDRPHSVRVSATGASYYYATDHPGNVVGLLNAAGQVVNEYEYDPWGRATVIAEGVPQPLRYTAREWDAGAGLYQVRARWYDPHTGRFVSEDPIGLAGGINTYAYALNNPVNYTDPSGLHVLDKVVVTACQSGWERNSQGHCEPSVGSDIDPDFGTGGYTVPHHRQFGGTVMANQRWPLTWREQERVQCLVDNWSSPEGQAWYPKLNFVTGGTSLAAQAEFIYPNTVAFGGRGSRGDPLRSHSELTMVHIILHEFGHGAQYAAMGKEEFDREWTSPGGEDALQADANRYAALHTRTSRTRCPF